MNATRRQEIVEVGDEQYTLSQFGLSEMEALETYVQGRLIAMGQEAIAEIDDENERIKRMQPIMEYAISVRIDDPDGFKYLNNTPGIIRMLYHTLKPAHPEITLKKCRELIKQDTKGELVQAFLRINSRNPTKGETPIKAHSKNGKSRQTELEFSQP